MNRHLFIARKVKGITPKELAGILKISEETYREFEHGLSDIPIDIAGRLADYFDIPTDFFYIAYKPDPQAFIALMEKDKATLSLPEYQNITVGSHLNTVKMAIDLMTAQQTIKLLLLRQFDMVRENDGLRELYCHLKENKLQQK